MSSFNALNNQIVNCQTVLQHTKQQRQHCQLLLWQRLQAPLFVMSGLWLGATLQTWAQTSLESGSGQQRQSSAVGAARIPIWLIALWRWWLL